MNKDLLNSALGYSLAYTLSFVGTTFLFPENKKILAGLLLLIVAIAWFSYNKNILGLSETTILATYLGLVLGISFAYCSRYVKMSNFSGYVPIMY